VENDLSKEGFSLNQGSLYAYDVNADGFPQYLNMDEQEAEQLVSDLGEDRTIGIVLITRPISTDIGTITWGRLEYPTYRVIAKLIKAYRFWNYGVIEIPIDFQGLTGSSSTKTGNNRASSATPISTQPSSVMVPYSTQHW
jgi:hypothetical protein